MGSEPTTHIQTTADAEAFLSSMEGQLDAGKIPLKIFNNPAIHELERQRIFGTSWIFIGHESEVEDEGDYSIRYIAQDPFIFVRDKNSEIQVLFNSCRHRGTEVCRAEQGNTSHFRCAYHGWTYSNTGELIGIPQKQEAYEGLDEDEMGLHSAPRVETYKGLVFASLAEEGPSLEAYLGDVKWYLDMELDMAEGGWEVIGTPHRWTVDADWKSGADNFAGDNYHTQSVHHSVIEIGLRGGGSFGEDVRDAYHIADLDGHSFNLVTMDVPPEHQPQFGYPDDALDLSGLDEDRAEIIRKSVVHTANIFPNFSLFQAALTNDPNERPAGFLSLRKWQPLGPGQIRVWSWLLVPKGASDAYKERAYEVGMGTFSPSGNFEQDDLAVWRTIADAADSIFANRPEVDLDYQMGMPGIGSGHDELIEDWVGPGTVYNTDLEEGVQRTFHRRWLETMLNGAGEEAAE